MANKHLQLAPHETSNPNLWWYEEPAGIVIVHGGPGHGPKSEPVIPWRSIRAALRRKDKPKEKK